MIGYHNHRWQDEEEITALLITGMLYVIKITNKYIKRHGVELEWNARRRIDCLFHGVAGNVALNELVLSSLANLEHEEPLAIDLANHCLLAEENGASARLPINRKG